VEQILIRNLAPGTKAALRARASEHGVSVEAEARAILSAAVAAQTPTLVDLLGMADGAEIDFEPERLGLSSRTPDL